MTKHELISTLNSFLRQRKVALRALYGKTGRSMYLAQIAKLEELKKHFDLRGHYNYHGLCIQVKNKQKTLELLLPSSTGHHKAIYERMMAFIEGCIREANSPLSSRKTVGFGEPEASLFIR